MSYWLEDANEDWLGDFATNKGIVDMGRDGPDSLKEFLGEGEADENLVKRMIRDCREIGELKYVADMLEDAEPPVFVTDGAGSV